jgi:hypothetical protein
LGLPRSILSAASAMTESTEIRTAAARRGLWGGSDALSQTCELLGDAISAASEKAFSARVLPSPWILRISRASWRASVLVTLPSAQTFYDRELASRALIRGKGEKSALARNACWSIFLYGNRSIRMRRLRQSSLEAKLFGSMNVAL